MVEHFAITYHYNAGVSIVANGNLYIFNYYEPLNNPYFKDEAKINPSTFALYKHVYVFVCNARNDIFEPKIEQWLMYGNVQFIVSDAVPIFERSLSLRAGQTVALQSGAVVSAFHSTDKGIALLLNIDGIKIFHAGTLNLWHWMETSTLEEIQGAQVQFERILEEIKSETINIAFFPLDARQGLHFDAGAIQFIHQIKPQYFMPIRFMDRTDVVTMFSREHSTATTTIMALTESGSKAEFTVHEGKIYLNTH